MSYLALFIFGYVSSHILEYIAHRYLFHNKFFRRMYKLHMIEHHGSVIKSKFVDNDYISKSAIYHSNETLYIFLLLLVCLPLTLNIYFSFIYCGLAIGALQYLYVHIKSHVDPQWALKNVPWHVEHHLGKNQNINWGVRTDILDVLFNSYKDLSEQAKSAFK
jgi:sterol desaturase/sphingolipid hydroxylase (fatty acid hydroxylase superfamily)